MLPYDGGRCGGNHMGPRIVGYELVQLRIVNSRILRNVLVIMQIHVRWGRLISCRDWRRMIELVRDWCWLCRHCNWVLRSSWCMSWRWNYLELWDCVGELPQTSTVDLVWPVCEVHSINTQLIGLGWVALYGYRRVWVMWLRIDILICECRTVTRGALSWSWIGSLARNSELSARHAQSGLISRARTEEMVIRPRRRNSFVRQNAIVLALGRTAVARLACVLCSVPKFRERLLRGFEGDSGANIGGLLNGVRL